VNPQKEQQKGKDHPKVLLFDIDATLLLSGHAGTRAVNRAFERIYGLGGAMDGIRADGKTDPLIFREIFEERLRHLAPEKEIPRVAEVYLEVLKEEVEHAAGFRLMQGVRELLEALARTEGFLLGLATGNFEQAAWIKLRRGNLDHCFCFGGFGSDSENRTEVVRTAIRRAEQILGHPVRPDLVYVIGDTPRDILHAREAGVRTVAVATGRSSLAELAQHGPDHLFADLSDTERLLRIFTTG
jgi:phosphoglycolate phosphatase-like HAD superfamily hydrolase